MAENLLSTKEACEYLGVSYWTLTNVLIKEIPHIRRTKKGRIKFRKATLDKYIEEREEKSIQEVETNFFENKKEESIIELREKYNKKTKMKTIQEIMADAKAKRGGK